MMDEWQLDFEWLRIRHYVRDTLDRENLPDLNAILFLIGIQELGRWGKEFSKEEKQDLMHIATCKLLSFGGYYKFIGRDADGWPHYERIQPVPLEGVKEQERYLKEQAIRYFNELEKEIEFYENEE